MEYYRLLLLSALLTGVAFGAVGHVNATQNGGNADPFAEAGLDQEAQVGDIVLLDGGGSRSPAGGLATYEWRIETPEGNSQIPSCDDCIQTEFVPDREGVYTVRLTVTDEQGRTDTDTMYVSVGQSPAPTVTVSGSSNPLVDDETSYTATVESGTTPIDSIEWRIDGAVVDRDREFDGGTHTLVREFSSLGERSVEATVSDDANRSASDDLIISVREDSARRSSSARTATVEGDQLVTGQQPLEGEYRIAGSDSGEFGSIRWYNEDNQLGIGEQMTVDWEPGTHQLYALADHDGSTHRITFSDGDEVVADPAPDVELDLERDGTEVMGQVLATDEFGSLENVSVYVGDDPAMTTTLDPADDRSSYETEFSAALPREDSRTEIRAVATDARGQATTDSTDQGQPELIDSGFVNTPVDSYHERLDEERYTAVHEIEIKLNGEDPGENLDIDYINNDLIQIQERTSTYDSKKDILTIKTGWAGRYPRTYSLNFQVENKDYKSSKISVNPSPPEVHVDFVDSGADSHDRGYLIHIDVSESFDPDGAGIEFNVADRDRIYSANDRIGIEFSDTPKLVASDPMGRSTTYELDLYDFYVPQIDGITEVSEDPYERGDMVLIDIQTEEYQIASPEYDLNVDLEIKNGEGVVESWRVVDPEPSAKDTSNVARQNAIKYYTGRIAIDAESFIYGDEPVIVVSNPERPDEAYHSRQVSGVDGIMPKPRNVEVKNIQYTVDTVIREVTASSRNERMNLEGSGYKLDSTSTVTESVELEKRETETTYSTETREFDSKSERDRFTTMRSDWSTAGTDIRTVFNRVSVWEDSHFGATGRFTGERRTKTTYPYRSSVSRPKTVTQYKYKRTVSDSKQTYLAQSTTLETDTRWVPQGETTAVGGAYRQASQSGDLRVGTTAKSTTWEMSKAVRQRTTVASYDDPSYVQETSGTVYGELLEYPYTQRRHGNTDLKYDEFSVDATASGLRSENELITAVVSEDDELNADCQSPYEGVC
jgi:hypothetical protein